MRGSFSLFSAKLELVKTNLESYHHGVLYQTLVPEVALFKLQPDYIPPCDHFFSFS